MDSAGYAYVFIHIYMHIHIITYVYKVIISKEKEPINLRGGCLEGIGVEVSEKGWRRKER